MRGTDDTRALATDVRDLFVEASTRSIVDDEPPNAEQATVAEHLYVGAVPSEVGSRSDEAADLYFDAKEIVPDDGDSLTDLVAARPVVAEHGAEVLSDSPTVEEGLRAMGVDPEAPLDEATADAVRGAARVEAGTSPGERVAATGSEEVARTYRRLFVTMNLYDCWRRTVGDAPLDPDPDAGRAANQTPEIRAVREARRDGDYERLRDPDDLAIDDAPTVGDAVEDVLGDLARDSLSVEAAGRSASGGTDRGHESDR